MAVLSQVGYSHNDQIVGCVTQSDLVVAAAIQLHGLGLNVLPVKLPHLLELLANYQKMWFPAGNIVNPQQKIPFILKPFWRNRMHLCNETCQALERETGRPCPGAHASHKFAYAFQDVNLGLVLGATSQNMAMIDCDDEESFHKMLNEFRQRGLDHWAHTTSRGGHLFFRAQEGIISKDHHSPYKHLEIYGAKRFSVIPPSLHFDGNYYCWIYGDIHSRNLPFDSLPAAISIADLKWLGVSVTTSVNNHSQSLPTWTAYQSKNNQQLWSAEILENHRNTFLRNLVYDCAAIVKYGYEDEDEVMAKLYDRANSCQPPYSTRQIDSMMRSAVRKEDLTLSKNYFSQNTHQTSLTNTIGQILTQAEQYDWSIQGRSALTNRSVFYACVIRALKDRAISFRASSRELAEIANIQTHKTVLNAISRLLEVGILNKDGTDRSSAMQLCFGEKFRGCNCPINTNIDNGAITAIIEKNIPIAEIEQDVFVHVGDAAYIVWKYLLRSQSATVGTIVAETSLSRGSVKWALVKLVGNELVFYSQAENVYIATPYSEEKLLQIAIEQGTLGNAARRHRHFVIEREIHLTEQVLRRKASFFKQIYQIINRQERDTNETR